MNRRSAPVCVMLGAVLLALSCGGDTAGPSGSSTPYPEDASATWDRLFDAHDAAALAAEYSDTAVSMPYNAQTVTGRAALQAEFERFFVQNDGATHQTHVEELLHGNGWVIERASYTLTFTPKGQKGYVVETGRHVLCRKLEGAKWRIAWELWNTDQPAKGSDATTADAGSFLPPID